MTHIKPVPPEHRFEDDGGPPAPEPPTCEEDRERLEAEVHRLRAELADARNSVALAEAVERNWSWHHDRCMDTIREAVGLPDGTIPEIIERFAQVEKVRDEAIAEFMHVCAERDALILAAYIEPKLWPDGMVMRPGRWNLGRQWGPANDLAEAIAAVRRAVGLESIE